MAPSGGPLHRPEVEAVGADFQWLVSRRGYVQGLCVAGRPVTQGQAGSRLRAVGNETAPQSPSLASKGGVTHRTTESLLFHTGISTFHPQQLRNGSIKACAAAADILGANALWPYPRGGDSLMGGRH